MVARLKSVADPLYLQQIREQTSKTTNAKWCRGNLLFSKAVYFRTEVLPGHAASEQRQVIDLLLHPLLNDSMPYFL